MTRKTLPIFRARHILLQDSLKTIKKKLLFSDKVILILLICFRKKKENKKKTGWDLQRLGSCPLTLTSEVWRWI